MSRGPSNNLGLLEDFSLNEDLISLASEFTPATFHNAARNSFGLTHLLLRSRSRPRPYLLRARGRGCNFGQSIYRYNHSPLEGVSSLSATWDWKSANWDLEEDSATIGFRATSFNSADNFCVFSVAEIDEALAHITNIFNSPKWCNTGASNICSRSWYDTDSKYVNSPMKTAFKAQKKALPKSIELIKNSSVQYRHLARQEKTLCRQCCYCLQRDMSRLQRLSRQSFPEVTAL